MGLARVGFIAGGLLIVAGVAVLSVAAALIVAGLTVVALTFLEVHEV